MQYLNKGQLIEQMPFSKSQIYELLKGVSDRKKREPKFIPEEVVCSAVDVIKKYPYFSGSKGQAYMIYHKLGYIPQHVYKMVKGKIRKLIFQEVSKRSLLPAKTSYEHERPSKPGEIWAEDFTQVTVTGVKFYVSLLIDVASNYYLGAAISERADEKLVESPVLQALAYNGGRGPERFLLSDNGSQYISAEHGSLLDKLDIVQKRIPSCTPEYNGSCECGVKEFKNLFYNVWAEMESKPADKEKKLLERVDNIMRESINRINHEIPRPSLGGVTPFDVHQDLAEEKIKMNQKYLEKEQKRKDTKPWSKSIWALVRDKLFKKEISDLELMTKFCFFLKRPLRKLPTLSKELLGN